MAVEGEPGLTGYTENQGFPYWPKSQPDAPIDLLGLPNDSTVQV